MILQPEAYDMGRVKKFMKHLMLSSKRIAEKQDQKEKVDKQVEKVKKLSLEKAPKEKLAKEWEKLENVLAALVSTNKKIVGVEESNSLLLKQALKNLDRLNDNISHIGGFAAAKKSISEQRLKELSERIKTRFSDQDIKLMEQGLEKMRTPATSSEIDEIESQLAMLEKKHLELKKSGKHDVVSLKRIEGMIRDSKDKLDVLRS